MLLRNADEDALERAAAATPGVVLCDVRPSPRENGVRFRLALDPNDRETYHRINRHKGHRMGVVCWHGHFDFLENLFLDFPHIQIVTQYATYSSLDDFYSHAGDTFYAQVGSRAFPRFLGEDCACDRRPE